VSVAAAGGRRTIAIVGNPNAGKTTLFNALTGSHQKVGNYPGVTVERISGAIKLSSGAIECIDIPGLYSLTPVSEDERVAVQAISGQIDGSTKPDLLVCVLDASNLERNLFLFTQIAELKIPTVVALTMVDRLESQFREIDLSRLSNLLGVDVVPIVGHKERGIDDLKAAIDRAYEHPKIPVFDSGMSLETEGKVALLRERLARTGEDFTKGELKEKLAENSEDLASYAKDFPEIEEIYDEARTAVQTDEPSTTPADDPASRYDWSTMVARATIRDPKGPRKPSMTDRLDRILTHRLWGMLVFAGIMYLVFQSIYSFASPLMDGIQWVFDKIAAGISPALDKWPILQSLVVDGLIRGIGGMLVFLPQILILFFFVAVLEGTGYLARAAFLMDRVLGWCGLNGRAFIPLLSSFACAIPGIMAARVMPDVRSRLATILVAPLMSCSARLPVYLLLIGTFIAPKYGPVWAGIALFGMHLLGLVVAIPIVWFLNRKVFKGSRLPFLLELPPYQWPKWRDVWLAMYFRGKVFVKTAGTVIVMMSILIWALSYFPRSNEAKARYEQQFTAQWTQQGQKPEGKDFENARDKKVTEQQLANSYLGRFGKTLEPVFTPAGFDWRITTAILSAFPARETVVPSLGIIFNLGGDVEEGDVDLRKAVSEAQWPDGRPLFTAWTAVSLMVFFALCCQCMSTLATIRRETNSWKWPVFAFSYMTILAYIASVGIFQLGQYLNK